jgi:asparagine synthase (glutamine-hydrolysing)
MCGVVGAVSGRSLKFGVRDLEAMSLSVRHRGPDSTGNWIEEGTFLGHRRLAVVDLSAAGAQPMLSHNGRFAISYNGEIYNHLDVRRALEREGPIAWRGHSDTETLVEAISRWGTQRTLDAINGMFAFALWDRTEKRLTLARDPFGEKPMMYAVVGDSIAFASELTAFLSTKSFSFSPDPAVIARFLQDWCVPAPFTILKDVWKLPPGCYLEWCSGKAPKISSYWSVTEQYSRGKANTVKDEAEALDELEAIFADSVKIRMMADVPVGAMLSGGVDSSLVTALMQKTSNRPVRTFTIGFDDPSLNEADHATAVAQHLGTEHEVLYVTDKDALDAASNMGSLYDEPFADASQIPTYLVSRLARQHVTVALTGDGCDELFSGYARHVMAGRAWNTIRRIPARKWLAGHVANLPDPVLRTVATVLGPMVPSGVNPESLGKKLRSSGRFLSIGSVQDLYEAYMTSWPKPNELMVGDVTIPKPWSPRLPDFDLASDEFVWRDSVGYLHNDILAKVDRASMAVSLETRIPALDKRLAAFSWRLPQNLKWRDGRGKWALREILYRHVPRSIVDRPKKGFAVPLDTWLRKPLHGWMNDLLSQQLVLRQGYLRPDAVQSNLQAFLDGKSVDAHQIWTLLMLQSWLCRHGF